MIATYNGREPSPPVDVPGNAVLVPWLSYSQTMPACDLVVAHGGHGTLMRALACGCPVVLSPAGGDMAENAARVDWAGLGVRLPRRLCTPRGVRLAVRRALRRPDIGPARAARRRLDRRARRPRARAPRRSRRWFSSRNALTSSSRCCDGGPHLLRRAVEQLGSPPAQVPAASPSTRITGTPVAAEVVAAVDHVRVGEPVAPVGRIAHLQAVPLREQVDRALERLGLLERLRILGQDQEAVVELVGVVRGERRLGALGAGAGPPREVLRADRPERAQVLAGEPCERLVGVRVLDLGD